MYRIYPLILAFVFCFSINLTAQSITYEDSIAKANELIKIKYASPTTGDIPYSEVEKAKELISENANSNKNTNAAITPTLTWYERGPNNIGGQVNNLCKDPNDVSGRKFWAATGGGGLWYTNDITYQNTSWQHAQNDPNWPISNTTWVAFNPANTQEIYVSTGLKYNVTYVTGNGIYKSTNGGLSFTRLSSTIPSTSQTGTIQDYCQSIKKMVINNQGHIFALTWKGIIKSTDGGNSWSIILNYSSSHDLEIGNDGILYCSFAQGIVPRIYRSNNVSGDSWTDISPNTSSGSRIEIALGNSSGVSNQVIYGFAVQNTVSWFKKSENGGTTWTDITIPQSPYGGADFYNYSGAFSLFVHPSNSNVLFAGGRYLLKSINSGLSWSPSSINYSASTFNNITLGQNSTSLALSTDYNGVFHSLDYGSTQTTTGTFDSRNKDLRISSNSTVSLFNIAHNGTIVTPEFNIHGSIHSLGSATNIRNLSYSSNNSKINPLNPNQILINGTLYNQNFDYMQNLNVYTKISDWDYPNNKIYSSVGYDYSTNNTNLRITEITSNTTNTVQNIQIPGNLSISFIKAGKAPNTIFVGLYSKVSNSNIVKISNINSNPVLTYLSSNLTPNASVSSIDIGETDNEILFSMSNYDVSSIWMTNDGGTTWINKDEANYGLPNIPVNKLLLIPGTKKVVLATQLGVFSSNDISVSNPAWEYSNNGIPTISINDIVYRSADSVLAVSTEGRGLYTVALRGFVFPAIDNKFTSTLLCLGGNSSVEFSTSGEIPNGSTFQVELSNSSGSFTNPLVIGSGTNSPISITIPNDLVSSNSYKIRLKLVNGNIISNESNAIRIINNNSLSLNAIGTIGNSQNGTYLFCEGSTVTLNSFFNNSVNTPLSYSWAGPNQFSSTGNIATISNASSLSQGVYTVSSTIPSCQAYTATVSIALTTSPVTNLITGRTFCSGGTILISNLTSFYSNVDPNYSWTGPNNFSSTATTLNISNATSQAQGIYTLTLTIPSGSCQGSATSTINITISNNLPAVSTYSGNTCQGSSNLQLISFLTNQPSGTNATYSWSGPDNYTSSSSNPFVTNFSANKAGIYTSTITYSGTCAGTTTSTVSLTLSQPNVNTYGPNTLCSGENSNVIAYVNGSDLIVDYAWSGPNGYSNSGSSLGLTDMSIEKVGVYTVTANYSGACNGTSTTTVNLSLTNYNVYFGGLTSYCAGATTDIIAGVSSSFGTTSFSWTGPNSFTATGQTLAIPNFSAQKAGTYILTATSSGCNSTSTTSINISFLSNPTAFINLSNNKFCAGANVQLQSFQNTEVTSYNWAGPNNFSSTMAYPTISNLSTNSAGTYTLTASLGNGCNITTTSTVAVIIVISAPPFYIETDNFDGEFCQESPGSTLYIRLVNDQNFNFSNISNVSWTGPNNFSSNSANTYIYIPNSNLSSGSYTASITFNSCPSISTTKTINISNVPRGNAAIFSQTLQNGYNPRISTNKTVTACNENFIYMEAGSNNPYQTSYSWTGPNGFSSTSSFAVIYTPITEDKAGIYTVTGTITGGCAGTFTSTVQLSFIDTPKPIISVTPENGRIGDNVTLTSNCSQNSNWSFTSSQIEPNSIPLTLAAGNIYTVSCNSNGCISKYSNYLQFNDCIEFPQFNNPVNNFTSKFESNLPINSVSKIGDTSNIIYDSSSSILLNPGFEVGNGSIFKATIDGCGNN